MTSDISVTTEFPEGWDDLVAVDTVDLPAHELHTSSRWVTSMNVFGSSPTDLVALRSRHGALRGGLLTRRVEHDEPNFRVALSDVLPRTQFPVRVLGGMFDGRSTPLVDDPTRSGAWRDVDAMVAEAEALARTRGERAVCFRSVDQAAERLLDLLRNRGYVERPGVEHLVLPVGGGWSAYLEHLSGQYPGKARREMRRLEAAGVTLSVEPLTRGLIGELAGLVVNLNARYDIVSDADDIATGLRMDLRLFRDDARVVLARLDGHVIGFLEVLWHGGNLWAWQAGFDYEARGNLPVWFAVFFYGLVDVAAALGAGMVDHTVGTERAKVTRGCIARRTVRMVKAI